MSEIKPELLKQDETVPAASKVENNLTISTKVSTDQLICKSPQESTSNSVKNENKSRRTVGNGAALLYLAVMQILFGLLMTSFGILVILHDASLSQIGGGLWGGCLAISAGTAGILAAAKNWCPLKNGAEKVAQTLFLALSLVSLAMAQLVFVLAATGLARDIQKTEIIEINSEVAPAPEDNIVQVLPSNYSALLSNVGLLVVSGIECICAAVASYKCARIICPCFRSGREDHLQDNLKMNAGREALVSSWLGKHSPTPPHIYLLHAPTSSSGRHSKMSGVSPIFAMQSAMMGPPVYPLIPAPLGPVPSPIIPTLLPRERLRRYTRDARCVPMVHPNSRSRSRSRSKSKEKTITTEDVARTYTGLDRTIAEEFIQICDSRNNSLCSSDSTCQNSCHCTSSDMGSRDYLIDKI